MLKIYYTHKKLTDCDKIKIHMQNLPYSSFQKISSSEDRLNGNIIHRYRYNDMPVFVIGECYGRSNDIDLFHITAYAKKGTDRLAENGWEQFNGVDSREFDMNKFIEYCQRVYEKHYSDSNAL